MWWCGSAWGTTWHGALESDGFRRGFPDPNTPGFAARRESMLDRLADAIDEHLDTAALIALIGIDL